MCRHPSVEFRAQQTKLLSSSWFRDSDHIQRFAQLLKDYGRSCLAHATTTDQTTTTTATTTRSSERLRRPTFKQVEVHKRPTARQGKTQHSVHNKERSTELGRPVVGTSKACTQIHGYGGEQFYIRSTFHGKRNASHEFQFEEPDHLLFRSGRVPRFTLLNSILNVQRQQRLKLL